MYLKNHPVLRNYIHGQTVGALISEGNPGDYWQKGTSDKETAGRQSFHLGIACAPEGLWHRREHRVLWGFPNSLLSHPQQRCQAQARDKPPLPPPPSFSAHSFFYSFSQRLSYPHAVGPLPYPQTPGATQLPPSALYLCPSCCPCSQELAPLPSQYLPHPWSGLAFTYHLKVVCLPQLGTCNLTLFSPLGFSFLLRSLLISTSLPTDLYVDIWPRTSRICSHHQDWTAPAIVLMFFSFWLLLSETVSNAFKCTEICVTSVLLTDDEFQHSSEEKHKFICSELKSGGRNLSLQ